MVGYTEDCCTKGFHPFIGTVSLSLCSNQHLYFGRLTGGELFEQIVQRGHFSERDASAIASCMISSVAHCHAKHVIHRDLKRK